MAHVDGNEDLIRILAACGAKTRLISYNVLDTECAVGQAAVGLFVLPYQAGVYPEGVLKV